MNTQQAIWMPDSGWKLSSANAFDGEQAQLVFVFGERELLKTTDWQSGLRQLYPQAERVGCSTAGEIIATQVRDDCIVAMAVRFEKTRIRVVSALIEVSSTSRSIGEQLVQALSEPDLVHAIVLADGLHVNGSELASGMNTQLAAGVAVTGGLAGDQGRFQETVTLSGDTVAVDQVVAVGFYGEGLKVGFGSLGGWDSFGVERTVTKSKGNILYELDNEPVLALYKRYAGEDKELSPATALLFPLSMKTAESENSLVRTVLAINPEDGSMIYAGDIPEGSKVQLMKANFERLIDGAAGAAEMTQRRIGSFPVELALLISCVGRKLVLSQRIEEELEAVVSVVGEAAAVIGFYSYGEICPTAPDSNQCQLHNQTMTITVLSED